MKLTFLSILVLLVCKLFAQNINTLELCNYNFKSALAVIDSSSFDTPTFEKKYIEAQQLWKDCLKNKLIPDFTVETISNGKINISRIKDSVIVLNFWSFHCPPCMAELPVLAKLSEDYKAQKIIFISISLDANTYQLKKLNPKMITVTNATEIFDLFGISSYPQTFIINKEHRIKTQFSGYDSNDDSGNLIRQKIDDILEN